MRLVIGLIVAVLLWVGGMVHGTVRARAEMAVVQARADKNEWIRGVAEGMSTWYLACQEWAHADTQWHAKWGDISRSEAGALPRDPQAGGR